MIKYLAGIGIVLLLLAAVVTNSYAAATPTATATRVDDRTFIFDASNSPCKWRYCTFSWRYYGPGVNRLGGTLGFGSIVTYTFSQPGFYWVVVTETEFCAPLAKTSCPGTTQVPVIAI